MPSEGYPTRDELHYIRTYDFQKEGGWNDLIDFLEGIWWTPEFGFRRGRKYLYLSTGGWSGNEEIISVLQNTHFWRWYWYSSRRGGHYRIELPKQEEK